MIRFLFGSYGTGKTTEIIRMIEKDAKEGRPSFLIVPEQEAVQAERLTLTSLPAYAQLSLEVLNFSRLYNRVCREYGGLCYKYITKPMKNLLMWKNLKDLSPLLSEYSFSSSDIALVKMMLSGAEEMKSCLITPEKLEIAANKLDADSSLRRRLLDFSLVYASYIRDVSEKYDDSSDDISKLSDILTEHDFFKGKNVYIDSFTSFTASEHRVIENIFKSADNVTVTIPLPSPDYDDISTESARLSLKKLQKNADKHGGAEYTVLKERKRSSSDTLNFLSDNLWKLDVVGDASTCKNDGSVIIEKCTTPYSEAEAVAAHILELLRVGARCRDILIVMRDVEKYRGIIEPALQKNDIPFFLSEKTDICTLPPIKLILSALRIKQNNWRREDVISYLKTGLCDVDEKDADIFENYITMWNIKGKRFCSKQWSMNPEGYTERTTERSDAILRTANEVKDKLTPPLMKLFSLIDSAKNIGDMCRAVYSFLCELELEEKLLQMAKKEASLGNVRLAKEYASIYGIIINALADIGDALGDEDAEPEELSVLLKALFSEVKVGTIPTSVDEVTIGSAATVRGSSPRFTFVMGLCEGDFPAYSSDTSLFNTADRSALSMLDIELAGDSDTRSSDEMMFVHRAFSFPSERLYLSTHTFKSNGSTASPSLPFNRVTKLLGITPHEYDGKDLCYLAGSPKSAISHLKELDSSKNKNALISALKNVDAFLGYNISDCESTSSVIRGNVSEDFMQELHKDTLYTTPSRLEVYSKCPLRYFLGYELRLGETGKIEFGQNNIGTFIHFILEKLIPKIVSEKYYEKDMSELFALSDNIVDTYVNSITPEEERGNRRLDHLLRRLKYLSYLIADNVAEEIRMGEFTPAFFELPTNGKNGSPKPLELDIDDRRKVIVSGIIDRVDLISKEDELFIRVVDYKTGNKDISVDDVYNGKNLQMLLYLYTLCDPKNEGFHKKLGLSEGKLPIPAGVMYLNSNIPFVEFDDLPDKDKELSEEVKKGLKRTGLLLDNRSVLSAMNGLFEPRFLAGIREKESGELTGKALVSESDFEDFRGVVLSDVRKKAGYILSGKSNSYPSIKKDASQCEYCTYRPICRRKNNCE